MDIVSFWVLAMNTILIGYYSMEAREVRRGRNVPAMASMFYPTATLVVIDLIVLLVMVFV